MEPMRSDQASHSKHLGICKVSIFGLHRDHVTNTSNLNEFDSTWHIGLIQWQVHSWIQENQGPKC